MHRQHGLRVHLLERQRCWCDTAIGRMRQTPANSWQQRGLANCPRCNNIVCDLARQCPNGLMCEQPASGDVCLDAECRADIRADCSSLQRISANLCTRKKWRFYAMKKPFVLDVLEGSRHHWICKCKADQLTSNQFASTDSCESRGIPRTCRQAAATAASTEFAGATYASLALNSCRGRPRRFICENSIAAVSTCH